MKFAVHAITRVTSSAALALALLAVGSPANAFRPIPGAIYPDACTNIVGTQMMHDFRYKHVGNSGKCKVLHRPTGKWVWPQNSRNSR